MDMSHMNHIPGGTDRKNPMATPQSLPIPPPNMNMMAAQGPRPIYPSQPWGSPIAAAQGTPSQQQQQHQLLQIRLRQQQLQLQQFQAQQQQQQQSQMSSSSGSQMPTSSPPSFQPPLAAYPPPSPHAMVSNGHITVGKTSSSPLVRRPSLESSPSSSSASPTKSSTSVASRAKSTKASSSSPDNKEKATPEQIHRLLSQCDWADKTIFITRQLLGGSSINGFLKATAGAQRIKKQRARQVASTQKSKAEANGNSPPPITLALTDPQAEEERVKKETLNPRTAKKMKAEMEAGVQYCVALQETIRSILHEFEPHSPSIPPPLSRDNAATVSRLYPLTNPSTHAAFAPPPPPLAPPKARRSSAGSDVLVPNTKMNETIITPTPVTTSSPGDPSGSTLRKHRKKSSNNKQQSFVPPEVLEYDPASGKRMFTKREHLFRIFEALRFRELGQGDYVAARVSSRDLWILARVVQPYEGLSMTITEFLLLKKAKRDALFRHKVLVKDVEEKERSGPTLVPRPLVLPLPRTFAEAADWGSHLKKGTRVYAMYPTTTSLYPATVTDNTTYCRGDDDIIVVEFDEDERDSAGKLPKWHIPARFVTLIPKEFPGSQLESKAARKRSSTSTPKSGEKTTAKKRNSKGAASAPSHKRVKTSDSTDSTLNNMIGELAYGDLDGTDFDFNLGFTHDGTDFALPSGSAAPPPAPFNMPH